jgi:hypothetical protein
LNPIVVFLVLFWPGTLGLLVFFAGALFGSKHVHLEVCGILGIGFLIIQDIWLRILFGWGEAWSGDIGAKGNITRIEAGSVAAVILYVMCALYKSRGISKQR